LCLNPCNRIFFIERNWKTGASLFLNLCTGGPATFSKFCGLFVGTEFPMLCKDTLELAGLPDGIYFRPKITIWVNCRWSCNGRCWYVLWPFGLFYGHLVHFWLFWYILYGHLATFSPVWYVFTKENLATLFGSENMLLICFYDFVPRIVKKVPIASIEKKVFLRPGQILFICSVIFCVPRYELALGRLENT
jgi:hypothetical protein